jgi:hypothetical protein
MRIRALTLGTAVAIEPDMQTVNSPRTKEQQETIKRVAKSAAYRELRGDATGHRDDWWVAEYSYEIGAVDAHGVVEMEGEAAEVFTRFRKRYLRAG